MWQKVPKKLKNIFDIRRLVFSQKGYTLEDLAKNADKIPEYQINWKLLPHQDAESMVMHQNNQKLRLLQKQFALNPTNFDSCYPYAKELVRQGKHAQALHNLNLIYQEYDQFTFDQKKRLKELYDIVTVNSSKESKKHYAVLMYCLFGYMAYKFIYDQPNGPSHQEPPKDSSQAPGGEGPDMKGGMDRIFKMLGNRTTIQEEKNIPTRFKDVLGIDEFKEELEEIVDYLKNPNKYTESGAKLPKGILLIGAPGTGKTLLARALAGEANCSFFYKSGSEFDEMFVGVGASRVRALFQKARQKAPSIIFIDEIDSIGGSRRTSDPAYARDTINQILTEMDGFKQSESVIVIGATNFEKVLDPALKRPGRFDKVIHVPLPDVKGREQIFQHYLEKIKYNEEFVQPAYLARQTSGFSGADIQNMVNLSILNAIKYSRQVAQNEDFEFALDRISMGVGRKNMFVSEKDKLMTAYHEGGHALTSLLTEGAIPLHKVTILPRGGALGFTSMIPEKDQLNYTKRGILASIDVAMGGRAAEDLFMGQDDITSGCSNDLAKATEMAYMYVKQLGMDDKISLISVQSNKIKTSDQFDFMVDMEVKKILEESYTRVKSLLKLNEKVLKEVALELVKNETLTSDQVKKILGKRV